MLLGHPRGICILRESRNQVLSKWLILAALSMKAGIRIIQSQHGIIEHQRLFLVSAYCFSMYQSQLAYCMLRLMLIWTGAGLGWNYPCDIWSVGCILVELCTVCTSNALYLSHCQTSLCYVHLVGSYLVIYFHIGWGLVPNSWEFGAPCNDGACSRSFTFSNVEESRVSSCSLIQVI